MGKQVQTVYVDDHSGKTVSEEDAVNPKLAYTEDGHVTEWDVVLTAENSKALRDLIAKFLPHADPPLTREVTDTPARTRNRSVSADNAAIRAWHKNLIDTLPTPQWKAMGLPDPADKGAIPQKVRDAYYRDNPDKTPPVDQDQD